MLTPRASLESNFEKAQADGLSVKICPTSFLSETLQVPSVLVKLFNFLPKLTKDFKSSKLLLVKMPFADFEKVFKAAIALFADGKFREQNAAVFGYCKWDYFLAEDKADFAKHFFQELQQKLKLHFERPYILAQDWKAFEEKWTAPRLQAYVENDTSLEVVDAVRSMLHR